MEPTTEAMIASHPCPFRERSAVARCIEACLECAQACTACADACLAERDLEPLRQCIRLDLDCADICETTTRVLSRMGRGTTPFVRRVVDACAVASAECGAECERHAERHEHCRVCGEACRRCEAACRALRLD
jgi:hypothetical protein